MNNKLRNIESFIPGIKSETLEVMRKNNITCKQLKHSKYDEIAFMYGQKRREFEFKVLSNGKYKLSTRFLGYKAVIERTLNENMEIGNDPDGRRRRFSIVLDDYSAINHIIVKMVKEGFELNPRTEHQPLILE